MSSTLTARVIPVLLVPLLSVLSIPLLTSTSWAAVDNVSGAAGDAGTAGAANNPGEDGTDGSVGEDATANATTVNTDANNSATANAGAGGRGGNGGQGVPNGSDGGDGGNGANGGNADATADTTVASGSGSATATANAGIGGAGGSGGFAGGGGTPGTGGDAGAGGTATASAVVTNSGTGAATASATANAGNGGAGGSAGGNGGDGGAAILGPVNGTSNGGNVSVSGTANGGNGGSASGTGDAGDGASTSLTDQVDGDTAGNLTLIQVATGGNSGTVDDGANGTAGDAFSSLSKSSTTSNILTVDARATGGNGGTRDSASGKAADGGAATSISFAENSAGEARANYGTTNDALGGAGGAGSNGADGGDGGAATRTATASTIGDYTARTFGRATGGAGGNINSGTGGTAGTGGAATDTSTVTSTGNGSIDSNSIGAYGGNGGVVASGTGTGGDGGVATATATGSNAGALSVTVSTTAEGGNGGYGRGVGESGGAGAAGVIVSATGVSTGGGSVNVTATQRGGNGGDGYDGAVGGAGADSDLVDIVTGSTSGNLTLTQTAVGGAGGTARDSASTAGTAGDATSSLTANNSDGGNVTGTSNADGGAGGGATGTANTTDGTDGGAAAAAIALSDTGNVTANAIADGGSGGGTVDGDAGDGGSATLGVGLVGVTGNSIGGGAVSVSGTANGGNGGSASGAGNAGDGASTSLTNQVDGDSTGTLTLTQVATGGNSGSVYDGVNGTAGDAFSSLSKSSTTSSLLTVDARATGGNGGSRNSATGKAADGGAATSVSIAENSAGEARANYAFTTDALGGTGGAGNGGADGGDGGAATRTATATTIGDYTARTFGRATGGGGGNINSATGGTAGSGGAATDTTTVTSTGNGTIDGNSVGAYGGNGGSVGSGTGTGGDGGLATSTASGSNAGTASVNVGTTAEGGNGGYGRGVGETGGAGAAGVIVAATGVSTGGGTVSVAATQRGGSGGDGYTGASGGDGADSDLVDVVTGSTSGSLTLTQTAAAGAGGTARDSASSAGSAGDATSSLTANNSDGGNVTGTSNADGGAGGAATGAGNTTDATDGGAAAAAVALTDTGNVTASAIADGGVGGAAVDGDAGDGGAASLGVGLVGVYGESTGGGTVSVTGTANGGNGGNASGGGNAGDGASTSLTDEVDGTTTGNLTLSQVATGGNSGTVDDGLNGVAGDAFSSLSRSSSTSAQLTVDARATGGNGGTRNSATGKAADGGAATSVSFAENSAGEARANYAFTNDALGGTGGAGNGGADGGDGGAATRTATASTIGDFRARTFGRATGGGGGNLNSGTGGTAGNGGAATDTTTVTSTGNGAIDGNSVGAYGGDGGSAASGTGTGGDGGLATATATGSNAGSQSVTVGTTAEGGNGGYGRGVGESGGAGAAGVIVAATGVSTGGGNVNVTATQRGGSGGDGYVGAAGGAGADSDLVDVVTGSTAGNLTLTQTAAAGAGGIARDATSTAGAAGNATSSLAANNSDGGDVTGTSNADGGAGGAAVGSGNTADATDGGSAAAAIALSDTGNVTANAIADGGHGGAATDGDAGDGGSASLGVGLVGVTGDSTGGGTVNVTGTANGGNGGSATGSGNAGDGASTSLTNQVDGDSTGNVTLTQVATGGDSGTVDDGASGTAGDAFSSLTKSSSTSSRVTTDARATGGNGGSRDSATGKAADGGAATSESIAENSAGEARANYAFTTDAQGGNGGTGSNGADGGDGGAATRTATASTIGDYTARTFGRATGGNGGSVSSGVGSTAGAGGDAMDTTIVTSTGNGTIDANSVGAYGGNGGSVNSGTGSGGDGGDANSSAVGSNVGTLSVTVGTTADGGNGGSGRGAGETGGDGGSAVADASGSGGGNITVRADADGGNAGAAFTDATAGLGGNAFATATGTGPSGTVTSEATTGTSVGNLVNDLTAYASGQVASTVNTRASAQLSGAGFDTSSASGQQAAALAYGAPADSVTLPNVLGNAVLANFDISGTNGAHTVNNSAQLNSDVYGMGVLGGRYAEDGSGTTVRTYTSSADYDVDTTLLQSGAQNLVVGFMNPVITGTPFDDPDFEVRFRIFGDNNTGTPLVDQTFTDEASFNAFFAGNTLDLGATSAGDTDRDIKFQLEVKGNDNPGDGVTVDYIFGNSTITERAVPYVPDTTVSVGDRHVGDVVLQGVEVTNVAVAGSDGADAVFTGVSGDATTNAGSISGLASNGGSDSASMQVGIDTSTSGNKSGNATIQLSTDGTVTGNAEVFGTAEVTVDGTVYAYADPTINNSPVSFGNVRVGDTAESALSVTNSAADDGFSENLNASVGGTSGGVAASGSFNGLGPQDTNDTDIIVGIDTSTAGNKSGDATIDLVSDGTGVNTLGQTALPSQVVSVSGNVFRLAEAGAHTPEPVVLADSHVGDTAQQALSMTNTAANDGFSESLNASIGGDTGDVSSSGSFNLLAAQATDNSSLVVGIDTSTAGAKSGTATISSESDGTGTSGIVPNVVLADQTVNVSGNVYRLAEASAHTPEPVVLNNVRVGDTAQQALTIGNTAAADGFSEALNAVLGATTGDATGAGSISKLAAGGSDNSSLVVGINTATAGAKSGTVALGLESDGDGINTLGQTTLAGQTVNVSGNVYRLAEAGAHTPEPVVLADSHVGDTAQQALSMTNTAANDGFSESLNASIGGDTGDVSSSGSFNLLAAQATDNSSLVVGIDTSTAGAKSGTATISSESDGTGTSGIVPNVALADQTVNVSGNVYRLAEASAHTPEPVVFGNVHVGDTAQQALTIGNTAAADGFSEALNAVLGATTGDATGAGSISKLAAGGSDNSSLVVGINTATAGAKSGTVALGLESDGDGINTLGQTTLAGQTVNVSGGVYSLAEATIDNPLAFAFGNVHVGDSVSQAVEISNTALDGIYSEALNASFGASSDARITNNGGSIALLAAGGSDTTSMSVGVDTSAAGVLVGTQTINFESDGTGTSGLGVTALAPQDLSVTAVIEGGVYRLANPDINNAQPIAFGNVREGDVVAEQAVSITNDVPDDGFSEALNAQAAGTTGGVLNNGGSFALLGPGATNDTAIAVSIDTSTAGDKSGNATIDFQSDGTGSSDLGITVLPSQNVAVTGAVYRLAEAGAHTPEPVVLADSHVGDTAQQALSMTNTAANDGFSESLNASIGGDTGDVSSSGSFNLLAAQATDNSSLVVGIDTSTAGAKSGTATISSESDGTGTSGIVPNVALADQTVNVSGNVYRLAEASAHTPEPVVFGNVHVGDTAQQALTIGNTAAADGFSEALNAVLGATTGDATGAGSISKLAAGGSDNSSLVVGINTATAGAKSGTVALGLESDGDGINTLGQTTLAGQTVNVSGGVYSLAEATIDNPLAFAFGNVHVGDSVSQAVEISNTALDGIYSEALNASFGASSDARITNNGGSIALLAAGGSDTTSMTVGVDTSAAGTVAGTQTINFESDGTGTSGLGITALDSQDLSVTAVIAGGVYRLANPDINNAQPVAFGNVRQGAAVAEQAISITNDVPDDGFSEALNAQAAGTTGGVVNNGGSFALLGPGATNDTAIAVSIDTSTAGDKSGNATIDFQSDGTGSSGLGITALPSEDVAVTGAVYRLAQGTASPDPIEFYARVGDTVGQALTVQNTALADGYSENLDASASASGNAAVSGGPVLALAAGDADNSSISVSADTSTSGVFSGQVDVAFESNGQQWGLGDNVDLGEQQIDVNTSVYAEAVASVTPAVDFGTVRVGTAAVSSVDVTNAGTGALVDDLRETSRSVDLPFSVDALTGDIAAGDSRTLGVGMDTSVAGVFSGAASLGFASHNDHLSDVDLGNQTIAFTGTVNNLAEAAFVDVPDPDGDAVLSGSGSVFLLDFGTIFSDDLGAMFDDVIGVQNIAMGPADLLAGTFSALSDCSIFCLNGMTSFDDFFDIAAGDVLGNLMVSLDTTLLGLGVYEDSIMLNPFSTLAGFDDIALDPITLSFRIDVRQSGTDVPLPGTLVLLVTGLLVLTSRRRRQVVR
jgi:hypothetical protein